MGDLTGGTGHESETDLDRDNSNVGSSNPKEKNPERKDRLRRYTINLREYEDELII